MHPFEHGAPPSEPVDNPQSDHSPEDHEVEDIRPANDLRLQEQQRMRDEQERDDMLNAVRASLAEYHGGPDTAQLDFRASSASQISTYHRQCSQLAILNATKENFRNQRAGEENSTEDQSKAPDLAAPVSEAPSSLAMSPRITDAASSRQSKPPADGHPGNDTRTEADPPSPQRRSPTALDTMENRMKAMSELLEFQLPHVYHDDGDTLVFIDPAPQQPELDDVTYEYYSRHYAQPSRMFSHSFLRLDSAYFEKAFGATAQYRILRRRHLANNLPPGIKYVIDLSPPSEGDDAVYLATELSCSHSVRRWYRGRDRWKIAATLICAPEEWMPYIDTEDSQLERQRHHREISECCDPILDRSLRLGHILSSKISLPPDLSPLRHRSAIERILLAIDGQDPRLNSAPTMWTTAALAKYFDISGKPHDPLVDYVVRWLRASPNSLFVEAVPEESLKIADSFCNEALCRESFAILVGEQALEVECGKRQGDCERLVSKTRTVFGRNKGDIHEAYQTRIEYARAAFIERVRGEFRDLLQAEWVENLPEFSMLTCEGSAELPEEVSTFIYLVKHWIRGWLYQQLCTNLNYGGSQSTFDEYLFPVNGYQVIWNKLLPSERIFCRTFWISICQGSLDGDTNMFGCSPSWRTKQPWQDHATYQDLIGGGLMGKVRKSDLVDALIRYNTVLRGSRPALPFRSRPASNLGSNASTVSRHPENLPETEIHRPDVIVRGFVPRSDSWDFQYDPPASVPNVSNTENWGLVELFKQVTEYIKGVSNRMLAYPGSNEGLDVELTNTLVCLQDSEAKYLPLWANGNDDGSGGVFDPEVPLADHGFTGAGPRVHTGTSSASSTSDFTEVGESKRSSHHTSTVVNDGFSDTLDRHRVYSANEATSSADSDEDLWQAIRESKQSAAASEAGLTSESGTGTAIEPSDYMSQTEIEDAHTRAAVEEIHKLEIAQEREELQQRIPTEAKGKGREVPARQGNNEDCDDDMLELEEMEEYDGFDDEIEMVDSDNQGTERASGDSSDDDMVMV